MSLSKDETKDKGSMLYKQLDLDQIQVQPGFNPRFDYGEIDTLTQAFDSNGIATMQPLRVVQEGEKGKETYRLIDGHRRYAAIMGMKLKPASVPVLVETKCKEGQDVELTFTLNQNKPLTPWEQAEVVDRLVKLNYSQAQIAKKLGLSPVRVSRLNQLTEFSQWIWDAGIQGKLSATLVWELWDSVKDEGKNKLVEVTKMLEKRRKAIEAEGVTASAFDLPSARKQYLEAKEKAEKEQAEAAKAKAEAEANKKAAEQAQALAKQQLAQAEANKQLLEKQHAEQDKGSEALKSLPTTTSTQPVATEQHPLPATVNGKPNPALPENQPPATEKHTDNASAKGQGKTEGASQKETFEVHVSIFLSGLITTITQQGKSADARLDSVQKSINAFAGKYGLWGSK